MADQLTLELATPTRLIVTAQVDEVVAPGSEGYFGVLPGHAPFLATLGIGELTYRIGREEYHVAVSCGFGTEETLRRTFVAELGVPPRAYRERFRGSVDKAPSPARSGRA